jgi:3-methylfumaryl-CoA hydratase
LFGVVAAAQSSAGRSAKHPVPGDNGGSADAELPMEPGSAWREWIGRQETAHDGVTATPCAALSATLDYEPDRPSPGTLLPPLWHWLYFLPLHRQSTLGPDGHPERGGFLPPVPLPRRMWAGSQIEFHRPLRIGDALTRVSTIEDITDKHGRSGPLVFVRVRHDIRIDGDGDSAPALTERHDIVYREAPHSGDVAPAPRPAPEHATWSRTWVPDDILLFRYSALTFNGHRIHYDRRYVTQVEGYPGLIVHGPLIATLLLDLLRREQPHARVMRFDFRAVRPLFDLAAFDVCGEPAADSRTVRLWARDHAGNLAMDATAAIADAGT